MFFKLMFYLSAFLTIFSAFMSAYTKNVLHSCVFLLGSLLGTAGLYLTLGADFIAGAQILVYVGGVTILMLFAVMLTGGDALNKDKKFLDIYKIPLMGNKKSFLISGLLSLIILFISSKIVFRYQLLRHTNIVDGFESTVSSIGELLITDYVLAFEMASVLLLASFVGAALIARPSKSNEAR